MKNLSKKYLNVILTTLYALSLYGCATISSVRDASSSEGVPGVFAADYDRVIEAAQESMNKSGLEIKEVNSINDTISSIIADKGVSLFSWGALVRALIEKKNDVTTLVRIYTKRKLAINIATKGDYSSQIFLNMSNKLSSENPELINSISYEVKVSTISSLKQGRLLRVSTREKEYIQGHFLRVKEENLFLNDRRSIPIHTIDSLWVRIQGDAQHIGARVGFLAGLGVGIAIVSSRSSEVQSFEELEDRTISDLTILLGSTIGGGLVGYGIGTITDQKWHQVFP